ncbi:hypothetical protein ZIOFF_034954 [Zingiber officinale]|uniref:Uncharacterized protein n=1 Tax=Zingiber officinale TaxID=94328 RepID=A0A8J5G8P6_ZINOF|nr:hypothetical protein ZIOFF_034954 [Zingiber officinale]
MPRSSRRRSHRSPKRSSERSDSLEGESLRERKTREEETLGTWGPSVSRDLEAEKRRSVHEHSDKEILNKSNGDSSSEKKRKARGNEEVVVADRWNGGKENDEKRSKGEDFGQLVLDKSSKVKAIDSKNRSSRRYDGAHERDEDRGGRNDSMKGNPERVSSQREVTYYYKDGKEKENNNYQEVQDCRHEKPEDLHSRKHGSRDLSSTEELALKKNAKINERQVQDVLLSAEIEKRPDKHTRRDENEDRDKWLEDSRDFDDRRLSSRDHSRNKSYKDERHDNTKYKGKYRIDNDRDQNHHDEKNQDEWSSKDRISDKSYKFRDENKLQDRHKKTKLHATDQDGTYVDVVDDTKLKDSRRRRYSDEKDDISDLKLRGTKEHYEVEKTASSVHRTSSHNGKPRSAYCHTGKIDSSPKNRQFKTFTSSSAHPDNDQNRDTSRHEESIHRISEHEERRCSAVSKGDGITSSGLRDRDAAPRSGKLTIKDDIHSGRSSKFERPRKNLDAEMVQRSAKYKDRGRGNDVSQIAASARESTPIGSSSIYRSGYIPDCSPNHMHPPPPTRVGTDSPSVLGPYQDDNTANSSERRSYNCYNKQTSDLGIGNGHRNTRKGAPNWPSPATNGFLPLRHGPPPTGFHPTMPQFPPPLLFGVRPMDLAHSSMSYHMHEMAERFSGVSRPFSWHNSLDQFCQPPMQMWDRTNGLLGNETPTYGRQEWDENGQLRGSRGWGMGSEMWKDQNIKNRETLALKKEQGSSTHSPIDEVVHSKSLPTESIDEKQSSDTATSKNEMESPQIVVSKKTSKLSFVSDNKKANYAAIYLSRIDISSDLAGLEMYQRYGVYYLHWHIDKKVESRAQLVLWLILFQMNKYGNKEKNSILKSFFPTAKDDIFKKAMSVYQKHSKRPWMNHAVLQTGSSEETEPKKASENEAAPSGNYLDSLEKVTAISADDDSANNMLVDNAIPSAEDSNLGSAVSSGAIDPYNNGPGTNETASAGEDTASVSRIPYFDENTH